LETIPACRDMAVSDRALVASVHPFSFEVGHAILVAHPLGGREAQAGVLELEAMTARGHNDLGLPGSRIDDRVVIEEHSLDDDWRRHRAGFDLLRIDHNEAFGSG